jgi:hypothetical protein
MTSPTPADKARVAAFAVAILGVFLTMWVLVRFLQRYTAPLPVGQERVELRRKSLAEINAANAELLTQYAEIDKTKGIWRVPIARAMELTLQEWQDPATGRSNLVARAEKAAAAPPKPPEKPSEFE